MILSSFLERPPGGCYLNENPVHTLFNQEVHSRTQHFWVQTIFMAEKEKKEKRRKRKHILPWAPRQWEVCVAGPGGPLLDPFPGQGICPPAALNIGSRPPLLWRTALSQDALTQKLRLPHARGMTHVGVQKARPFASGGYLSMEESTLQDLPWAQGEGRLQLRPHPSLAPRLPHPAPSQYDHPPLPFPWGFSPYNPGDPEPPSQCRHRIHHSKTQMELRSLVLG